MFFSIKKDIYDKKVLLKTCYKFTDEYYIHLDSNKDEFVIRWEGGYIHRR